MEMKPLPIRTLSELLKLLEPNEFLNVRPLPTAVGDEFGLTEEKSIVISGTTRSYYTRGHSWLSDKPEEVIKTLLDPRQIVADKAIANRVLFYRKSVEKLEVLVVVEIKKARGISHKVVTAFEAGPDEVARRKSLERAIWEQNG